MPLMWEIPAVVPDDERLKLRRGELAEPPRASSSAVEEIGEPTEQAQVEVAAVLIRPTGRFDREPDEAAASETESVTRAEEAR
ncbi:MAG: hypothetical protein ACXW08_16515 [Solirubrobacteraceae bacterium]